MSTEQENTFNVFCDYILELIEKYEEVEDKKEEGAD